MPRLARLDAPGILHHVIGRGIERKKIFFNDTDRCDFIDRLKKNLRLSGQRMDIAALAEQVCNKYDICMGELCCGSRRQVVVEARGSLSWIAVRELGYSGADVARFLGVTNSCVTRFVASGKRPNVDDLIRKL